MLKTLGVLLLFLPITCMAMFSRTEISMVATQLDHYIDYDNQGAYDILMKKLSSSSGIDHNYKVLSYARGKRSFIRKEMACVLPASNFTKLQSSSKYIQSEPLIRKQFFIYTLKNQRKISQINELNNKIIGVVKNSLPNHQQLIDNQQAKVIEVSELNNLTELLNKGRVDAIILDTYSVESLLNKAVQQSLIYDQSLNTLYDDIKITCHKTEATQQYINYINQAINSLDTIKPAQTDSSTIAESNPSAA